MDYVVALLPSIGLAIIFVIVMRAILLADRRERAAFREFEKTQRSASTVVQRDNSDSQN
ncbi:hypothetical protein [uncultured Georgenia sp.]|uniref:hypothetical protein n=1 Tax=uncultured Georgenia sp. TaxID=378209 RepID=UPI00261C9E90|nr:hypothetical protein [uncultured Georgenia sp.]HLV04178.1 hypothetical protein [Actinomycetaceae bacterium]